MLEVPSGAWADTLDRRRLLVLSGALYTAGFACWLLWPNYLGFLVGFLLWALSSALMSGTFEALLYDELAAIGRRAAWGRLRSRTEAVAVTAMALASLSAAPLYAWGGYELVGWTSVGAAAVSALLALSLPPAPAARRAPPARHVFRRYVRTLGAGVREAGRVVAVRRAIAAYASVVLLVAFDEYVPLVLRESGATTTSLGFLLAAFIGAQAVGTALSERVSRVRRERYVVIAAAAGLLLAVGSVLPFPVGFAALCVGYLLATAAMVAGEIRLQHLISGRARATVTSVAGIATEIASMTTFGLVALGTLGWSLALVVAVLALPFTAAVVLTGLRLPAVGGAARRSGPS